LALRLFRVFPYLEEASDDEPGGALFRPRGGANRADSPIPGAYRCLYVGDTPEGAIAEAFGRFDLWDRDVIEADPATPLLPGSRFALAAFELGARAAVRDLDDAQVLLEERLRPSAVVARDRRVSQAWAARIHAAGRYAGIAWWSYYDSVWRSVALWDVARLKLAGRPAPLTLRSAEVERAARTIVRRLL
jgi:hypothetical protein